VLAIATIAATGGAAPLAAQGPGVFEIIASRKQAATEPLLGGISIAHYRGPIGIRFSGALNLTNATDSLRPVGYQAADCRHECRGPGGERAYYQENGFGMFPSIGAWTADADLVFAPVRAVAPLRALLLGFSPYAFAGVGGYGVRPANSADTTHATWSVGGGAHHELLGWLGVGAEARYRRAFSSDSAFAPNWRDNLEYRVGLTVSFGSRHATQVVTPAPVAAPVAVGPCGRVPCETDTASAPGADSRLVSRVLDIADGLVDTPYASGGTTPRGGFDAPGFVRYVFGEQGVSLPATVREMAGVGSGVSTNVNALRPGDLLFFANEGMIPNHVAIYAGRGRIIHSTASGNGVRYDTLDADARGRWFDDHLVAVRRIGAAGGGPEGRALPNGADRAPRPRGGAR
jgi:hypothetical protein